MANVEVLTRFATEAEYVAEMRHALIENGANVRTGYAQLVERLAELLTTERLLREEVLSGDADSARDRLRGVFLVYHRIGLETVEVRRPSAKCLGNGSLNHDSRTMVGALGVTEQSLGHDLYFAVLASYSYWLRDSDVRFLAAAEEEYSVRLDTLQPALTALKAGWLKIELDRMLGDGTSV